MICRVQNPIDLYMHPGQGTLDRVYFHINLTIKSYHPGTSWKTEKEKEKRSKKANGIRINNVPRTAQCRRQITSWSLLQAQGRTAMAIKHAPRAFRKHLPGVIHSSLQPALWSYTGWLAPANQSPIFDHSEGWNCFLSFWILPFYIDIM